jgi:hypothetical protein
MSLLGQTRKSNWPTPTSALPLKADIRWAGWHVRFVPEADIDEIVIVARSTFTKARRSARRKQRPPYTATGNYHVKIPADSLARGLNRRHPRVGKIAGNECPAPQKRAGSAGP